MENTIRKTLVKLGYHSKPDFIIIGVQKGGTSGLYSILKNHSLISSSSIKEVHYFDDDDWYNQNKTFQYHLFFPLPHCLSRKSKVFEASPLYVFHPDVASRLYSYNPNLKLILLLRDPAERAFSAWTMYHHHFKTGKFSHLHDPRSFSDAISDEIEKIENESFNENRVSYVKRGFYHLQIEKYLSYFNMQQLLIIESKSLREHSGDTLMKIQDFIEVPNEELSFINSNKSRINEKEKYVEEINSLREFYKPYNDKLFKLIGENYDWNKQ